MIIRSSIYVMGVIGAAVFYIKGAVTFWMGVLGCIKALFWPAMIVYKSLILLYK
ncbi:MAG: hypothetical protein ABII64_04845 [Elusimicrobiota bacterium]